MVFGGGDRVGGGYLELEVLILVFGCELRRNFKSQKI